MKWKDSYLAYTLMYFCYYAAYALFTVLIGVHVLDSGFSSVHVSLLVSAGLFSAMMMQGIIGYLNDKFHSKRLNMFLLGISSIGAILFIFAKDFVSMTICYALVFSLINGINPVIEKMATTSRFRYGRIRIWGTIGFAIGSQLAGMLYKFVGPAAIYVLYACLMSIAVVSLAATKEHGVNTSIKAAMNDMSETGSLLKYKTFLIYLAMVFIFNGSFNVSNTHLPNMLKADGLDVNIISTVLSIAVMCELPLIYFSHLFMDKMRGKVLLYIVLIGLFVQASVYAFVPNIWVKIIVTLMGKHTIGMLFIMTNLKIVRTVVPETIQSSALSAVAMVGSVSAIVLQNIAGIVITTYGYSVGYVLLVGVVLLAMVIGYPLRIKHNADIRLFH